MSVDHIPTCPDCGDDLVYEMNMDLDNQIFKPENTNWFCPGCGVWFNLPEGDPDLMNPEKY